MALCGHGYSSQPAGPMAGDDRVLEVVDNESDLTAELGLSSYCRRWVLWDVSCYHSVHPAGILGKT